MNHTELKTLRQSLFLSVAEAAALHGVGERVYRYWESGDWAVPDDVAARMARLDDAADTVASHENARLIGDPSDAPAVLIRFASDADLWAMLPADTIFTDWRHAMPYTVHAAGIDRARQDMKGQRPVRVVTMDRAAYAEWLGQQPGPCADGAASRDAWALTVLDPPTRAKRIAQASGEQKSTQASGEQITEGENHGR